MRGRRPVVYPFLIAAFPILSLYAQNAREVRPAELVAPLALALLAVGLLWAVAARLLRDPHRAGLIAVVAVALVASLEAAPEAVRRSMEFASTFWVRTTYGRWPYTVMPAEVALAAGIALLLRRRPRSPRDWTPALNAFALILVATTVVPSIQARWASRPEPGYPALARLDPSATKRPDIYYIILDGCARADVLKSQFDYDLEPMLRRLEQKGFYVARRSTSNYCQTPLSLSSSLNGTYHTPARDHAEGVRPFEPAWFRDNAVMKSLRPLGYRFVTFASGFDFTERPGEDLYLSPYPYLSNFHHLLIDATPVRHLLPERTGAWDSYTLTRERTLFLLDQLPAVAKIDGPTFAVAHFLAPHPPFVFGPNGEDVSRRDCPYMLSDGELYARIYGSPESYIAGYRAEMTFLAAAVEHMIDRILAESPEPPIIVLQSDHGSGLHLDTHRESATDHRERMSILNAYYVPGGPPSALYDSISPVNTFRVLLNDQFGARLPLLPDECYYSTWGEPFLFTRVTDVVRGPAPAAVAGPTQPPSE